MTDRLIAIHTSNAGAFSHRWIEYCAANAVRHEVVNCYRSDIIEQLRRFDGLLWHFHHLNATDLLMARHVLAAAESMGLAVFPDAATAWHFDDKIAQKYLLEAISAPTPATYVFYSKHEALDWLRTARYPLVWKLRRGAGSHNVRLIDGYPAAERCCEEAFGRGINPVPPYGTDIRMRIGKIAGASELWSKMRRMPRAFFVRRLQRRHAIYERGYVLFQQFIAGNETDTRVTVIGDRAFAFQRNVRANDFRASGSGSVSYDRTRIAPECLRIAFAVADALKAQSLALDLVQDRSGRAYVLEISYGYVPKNVREAGGFWDRDLQWHQADLHPEDLILEGLLATIDRRQAGRSAGGVTKAEKHADEHNAANT